jgi:hypothetical protein
VTRQDPSSRVWKNPFQVQRAFVFDSDSEYALNPEVRRRLFIATGQVTELVKEQARKVGVR